MHNPLIRNDILQEHFTLYRGIRKEKYAVYTKSLRFQNDILYQHDGFNLAR